MIVTLKQYLPHINAWTIEEKSQYYALGFDGMLESELRPGSSLECSQIVPYIGIGMDPRWIL